MLLMAPQQYLIFPLKQLVSAGAPHSVVNPMYKIYSPFDVLLISKKPKRRENVLYIFCDPFKMISSLCRFSQ